MIEKRTVIDQIEIKADTGIVNVRLFKQIVEDGKVLSQEYHRTSVLPGLNPDAQMAAVNAHLQAMNCAPVADYQMLKDHVALAHTPERIAAFNASREEQ